MELAEIFHLITPELILRIIQDIIQKGLIRILILLVSIVISLETLRKNAFVLLDIHHGISCMVSLNLNQGLPIPKLSLASQVTIVSNSAQPMVSPSGNTEIKPSCGLSDEQYNQLVQRI